MAWFLSFYHLFSKYYSIKFLCSIFISMPSLYLIFIVSKNLVSISPSSITSSIYLKRSITYKNLFIISPNMLTPKSKIIIQRSRSKSLLGLKSPNPVVDNVVYEKYISNAILWPFVLELVAGFISFVIMKSSVL